MSQESRSAERLGVATTEKIVTFSMGCGWQEFAHSNDKGVDGVIIDRKGGEDTGSVYYAQVKCGRSYLLGTDKRKDKLEVNVGKEYIQKHRPRWEALTSPAILVWVDDQTQKAWWTDLKSDGSYCPGENESIILIPKEQRFERHSLGHLRDLRSYVKIDRDLDLITLRDEDIVMDSLSGTLKSKARNFYKEWSNSPDDTRRNPALGVIRVSRVGWRHISRSERGGNNIMNSWRLLGAARRIILENDKPHQIHRPDITLSENWRITHGHLSLRSRVKMPAREEKVVQVILKRKKEINLKEGGENVVTWFYSVHEPRRSKKRHQ